ncbi:hypothetical protein B4168_4143 [Anoxybacillus flavithermus]|nr:hypothetical protein GT20_1291 [Parageobacillus thermoglucosidasius TNO-09.020]KYD13199.1 hypothetical protein B4168_4143 [Anoxybacillus flavithermus]OAO86010.1 hypothetical protein GT23_2350 [Parageobacillus thermoglucosidasius]
MIKPTHRLLNNFIAASNLGHKLAGGQDVCIFFLIFPTFKKIGYNHYFDNSILRYIEKNAKTESVIIRYNKIFSIDLSSRLVSNVVTTLLRYCEMMYKMVFFPIENSTI